MRFVSPQDLRLIFSNDVCGIPASQALPIADLVVTDYGQGPLARTRDGKRHFDLIECFAGLLGMEVVDHFKIVGPTTYTPRIAIDRLVVCRETWRFLPGDLVFPYEKTDSERFLAARRWMHAHNLPRCVFVKMPTERKPFYVDFSSPILINMLAKAIRQAAERSVGGELFTVTEMLPRHDQLWLNDAQRRQYTSELRFVAVDLA
jgi:hypothetical protein